MVRWVAGAPGQSAVMGDLSATTVSRLRPSTPRVPVPPTRRRLPLGVLAAALAVALARLPFVDGWLGRDESGYLAVGQQWHAGGTSLYGGYWVDRPPLLVSVFRLAAVLGGAVPLRLIGVVAAVVSVVAVGWTAHRLAGPRAATWAALVAAAFLVSPLSGATEVDGELLAAPFVAVGFAAVVGALSTPSRRRAVAAGACAGAAGVAAVLVKQNMVDVFVFGGVAGLLTARYVGPAHLTRVAAGVVGGGALVAGVTALWTVAHGTSLAGVWFAMYPFRLAANRVMAAHPSSAAVGREHTLLLDGALSGMVLVVALLVTSVVRARRDHPSSSRASGLARAVPVALAATVAYDVVSIYLGEGYWSHYLIQLAVPLALAAGLAADRRPRPARIAGGVVVASAAAAVLVAGPHPLPVGGNALGAAIGAVSAPHDTIVTIWGHSDVTRASGLRSPYPYLWYLPARTLDPHVRLLSTTLAGRAAPTWFVDWSGTGLHGVDTTRLTAALRHDYHRVADVQGVKVFLHDGVRRHSPVPARPARPDATSPHQGALR